MRKALIGTLQVVGIMGALAAVGTCTAPGRAAEREELTLSTEYENALFACFSSHKSIKVLSAETAKRWGKDLYIIRADRNYDGEQDLLMIYDMAQGKPATFPHYYVLDTDFDGQPDKAYRDMQGNGRCEQMQEVPVAYVLTDNEKEM